MIRISSSIQMIIGAGVKMCNIIYQDRKYLLTVPDALNYKISNVNSGKTIGYYSSLKEAVLRIVELRTTDKLAVKDARRKLETFLDDYAQTIAAEAQAVHEEISNAIN